MSFCSNCGAELKEGATLCENCGAKISSNVAEDSLYAERKQVYAGFVKKCPACGAELQSMEAVCPNCGHEINSAQVSSYLSDFIAKLDECDQEITDEEEANRETEQQKPHGWKSWAIGAKVFWVILNVFALCAPLIIYNFISYYRRNSLTPCEKRKTGVIENFQIPNEKQAIVDTLSFIKGKVNALSVLKATSNSWHWMKLWYVKATQIREKAALIMPEDRAVESVFQDIAAHHEKMHHAIKRKHIIWAVCGAVYIFTIALLIKFLTTVDHPAITALLYNGDESTRRLPIAFVAFLAALITFLAWLPKKVPSSAKIVVSGLIWISVLIIGIYYSSEIKHDNYISFSREVNQICVENEVLLTGIRQNKNNVYIDIQSITYEAGTIDKIEQEIRDANEKYQYEIHISISDENGITIRETTTDETGLVAHSEDNTNGFLNELKTICENSGMELAEVQSGTSNDVIVRIVSPDYESYKIDIFSNAVISAYNLYDYRGLTLNVEDRDRNDIRQIKIDRFGTQTVTDVYSITNKLMQLCKDKEMIVKRSILSGERIVFTVQIPEYKSDYISSFASSVSQTIGTTTANLSIDIQENGNLAYRIVKTEFGTWININAHDFTEQIESICKKRNVALSSIYYSYSLDEVSVSIDANTGKKRESNNIESDIVKLLKKSEFEAVSLTIYSPSNSSWAIRESSITAAGATQTLDRTQ